MRDEFTPEDLKRLGDLIKRAGTGAGLSWKNSERNSYYDSSTGKQKTYESSGQITGGDSALDICRLLFDRRETILTRFNADETGWLIELREKDEPPLWYKIGGTNRWTPNSVIALRFSRKSDAEAFVQANDLKARGGFSSVVATEHSWAAPISASNASPSERDARDAGSASK